MDGKWPGTPGFATVTPAMGAPAQQRRHRPASRFSLFPAMAPRGDQGRCCAGRKRASFRCGVWRLQPRAPHELEMRLASCVASFTKRRHIQRRPQGWDFAQSASSSHSPVRGYSSNHHACRRGEGRLGPLSPTTPEPVSVLGAWDGGPATMGAVPLQALFSSCQSVASCAARNPAEKVFRLLVSSSAFIDDETHPIQPCRP